jgi:hypothetical protein
MSSGIMEIERILCEALGTTVPNTADGKSQDGTRASGHLPWGWIILGLILLSFFLLLV